MKKLIEALKKKNLNLAKTMDNVVILRRR